MGKNANLIIFCKHLPYTERLKQLMLPTFKYRYLHGDMIEVFKIVHEIWKSLPNDMVEAVRLTLLISLRIVLINIGLIKMFFFNVNANLLELEVYQFVCESEVKMRAKRTTCARHNTLD